ncbi:hypothetical protein V5O48_006755 [Marasmius crinis-equi]|uniref:NmrA-like domain-containing protein n=1 Tax=Marasmius crinis-equi TaxID=585013 RepID=A0ABR3FJ33_9AGAR
MSAAEGRRTIFFLGATGFLGSEVLILLANEFPNFHIRALVRGPVQEKEDQLKAVYNDLSVVEGTLEDAGVIEDEVAKADFVINCASSDHWPSVKATLTGLEKNSAGNPSKPPLYIHVSGLGITSDNCKGEHVELKNIPCYTDIEFKLEDCPPYNTHLESDKPIVQAGTRTQNPVRTIIVFPGWIYGIGRGIQKTTLPIRNFITMAKTAGHAGTWGKGYNRMNNIHVRDCANAVFLVFKAALEGKADEGAEGLCNCFIFVVNAFAHYLPDFAVSDEPRVTNEAIAAKVGDVMHAKGLIKEPGSRPLPDEIVEPLGFYGWSLLGGNQITRPGKLFKLGWEPTETKKLSLMDSITDEIELALKNSAIV